MTLDIQHIIKTWNENMILDSDFVDCVIIHTHMPCVIFLWRQKCENDTWVQTFFDESFVM